MKSLKKKDLIGEREENLKKIFLSVDENARIIIEETVNQVIFLERKMEDLKNLPFMRVDEADSRKQKATPAAKQYKELLQQHNNCIKILYSAINKNGAEEESPLVSWLKMQTEKHNE